MGAPCVERGAKGDGTANKGKSFGAMFSEAEHGCMGHFTLDPTQGSD